MARVLIIAPGALNPDLVDAVQVFRGGIYAADGAVSLDAAGRHVEAIDALAFHLVLTDCQGVGACLRYHQRGRGVARLGGWAVAEHLRGSTAGVRLVLAAFALARRLGDSRGFATATVRHGSADILRRLGGRLIVQYFDAAYGCEMQFLEFRLDDVTHRAA